MRRAVVSWILAVALLAGAATGGVLVLGGTLFGAAAFVRVYLEALARGDAAGALSLPGVVVDADTRTDFLVDAALPGLGIGAVEVVSSDGVTEVVTVEWTSEHGEGVSTFDVARTGSRLAIFPAWEFAVSPVATLRLAVEHDARFELQGVPADTGVAAADPVAFTLLVPGVYRVDHRSTYLRADAVDIDATRPGSEVGATLDVHPAAAFVEQVDADIRSALDACVDQEVLFPTGCALGHAVANRVVSAPDWSIVDVPPPTIEPGLEFGTWVATASDVVTNLRVDVQSLYDGDVTPYDEDLVFTVRYRVTIRPDDLTLTLDPLL